MPPPSRPPASPPPGPSAVAAVCILLGAAFLLRALFAIPPPDPSTPPPGALGLDALARGEWWTSLTWIFTHGDWLHLAGNLALIIAFGREVERRAGPGHFAYIFLTGSWAGAALCLCLRPDVVLIGASGSALALLGAFAAFAPDQNLLPRFLRRGFLRLSARALFLGVALANLGLEIASRLPAADALPALRSQAHLVHLGGLVAGWLYARRLAAAGLRDDRMAALELAVARLHRLGLPDMASDAPGMASPPPPPPALTDDEFVRSRVDPILEKLYATGAASLTPEEQAILEEAARRFSRPAS